ncbi:MAG: hypothetical protein PXZ08_02295 [Actinomycetota bacterium]|nr:hypothetical protein [Actinomycetota bacterium]
MRRMIPHFLLAAMSALAILALVLSVGSAQRISSFATPAPGEANVVASFHAVVQRSLNASSFTVDHALNYQAPDRTATIATGAAAVAAPQRVIGQRVYLMLGIDARGVAQWGTGALSHQADQFYGPTRATQEFSMLLGDNSVVRAGTGYIVKQVVPADYISSGNPGQLLITYTLTVAGGYVTGVTALLHGWVTIPVQNQAGHLTWTRVNGYQSPESTYTDYGTVARIVAPPSAQTSPLTLCSDGTYALVHQGHGVCSIYG